MYVVTSANIQRWPVSGDRIAAENSVPWSKGTLGDEHRQFYVYDGSRNVHITKNHLTIYSDSLSQLNTTSNTLHPITQITADNINRYEFEKIYSLGGYTDRFILKMTMTRDNKIYKRYAVCWIEADNSLKYRIVNYIPDNIVDIVPLKRGAGVAILNTNSSIWAHDLLTGNELWRRDINIGNPTRGAYIYPRCELVVVDNDERLRIFDDKDGTQKAPPPIEWVNHTFRDMKTVKESDKIMILTNRKVMVIDTDDRYRINQYHNITAHPPGKYYRFHKANDRNEFILGYENEVTHKNFRMFAVNGDRSQVCHPNCGDTCLRPLRFCSGSRTWWKSFWIFKDCDNCTRNGNNWWCRLPEWLILGLAALLALLFTIMCFCCICCCRGNGTRDVHTQENFTSKDTYVDEEVMPMEEEIIEEQIIEEQPRVY